METKQAIILEELRKVSLILGKNRFTRDEFYKHSSIPISQDDIEKAFGSYAKAMVAADLKPAKWSILSDDELFKAYDEAFKKLGHYPLGHPGYEELSKVTPISGHTFKHRFGGLKNFLFEYKSWLLDKESKNRLQLSPKVVQPSVISETPEIEEEYFDNKQRYVGRAAENLVVSELLFRGFNAQVLPVDEGIDVIATNIKKNELYLIQVKHTYYDKPTYSRTISITVSTFEKNKRGNVFYICVLEKIKNQRVFLILPFHIIDQLLRNGSIVTREGSKKILFSVSHKNDDDAYIGNTDVSRYLDAWDVLL